MSKIISEKEMRKCCKQETIPEILADIHREVMSLPNFPEHGEFIVFVGLALIFGLPVFFIMGVVKLILIIFSSA